MSADSWLTQGYGMAVGTRWSGVAWALGAVVVLLSAVSVLPLIETNVWWLRYLDFPRVQISLALVAALVLFALVHRRGVGRALVILCGLVALGYQAYRLHPYAPFMPVMAVAEDGCEAGDRLRVMVSNVRRGNRQAEAVLARVAEADPDLVLLMETDAWWDERLAPLGEAYPYSVQHLPEQASYYGMHLFSKMELIDPEFTFEFGPDTPAVETGVALPSGAVIGFDGVHPRPPLYWSQSTARRDATILSAALEVAGSGRPSILAGDLNAVPWERVTRRAMRLGGLLDPRVGRGLYPTYDAQSRILSWPLDQVLYQPGFTLMGFEVLGEVGSDHYPVLASLCHRPEAAALQPPPQPLPRDLEEARTSMDAARSDGPAAR